MIEISIIPLIKGEDKWSVKELLYCRTCDEFRMKPGNGRNLIFVKIKTKPQ